MSVGAVETVEDGVRCTLSEIQAPILSSGHTSSPTVRRSTYTEPKFVRDRDSYIAYMRYDAPSNAIAHVAFASHEQDVRIPDPSVDGQREGATGGEA